MPNKQKYYHDDLEAVSLHGLQVGPSNGHDGHETARYHSLLPRLKRKRLGRTTKFWWFASLIGIFILTLRVISTIHKSEAPSPAPPAPTVASTPHVGAEMVGNAVDMTSGGYGGYPRANLLADGSLIGTYPSFPDGNNVINVVKSTDGGSSWQLLSTVVQGPSNTSDIDNPYILELPSGRLLVTFRDHSKNSTTGAYIFYRITICFSDDSGHSWRYLSQPVSDPAGTNEIWEPFLRNTLDGNLQIYYSRNDSGAGQSTLMRTSYDGGSTWSMATIISLSGAESRDGMIGVTTISGSNLIAVFESKQKGAFTVNSITSSDDGNTWRNRTSLYKPTATGTMRNNAGSPQVITVGNLLVCSFMTDEDTSLHDWFLGANIKIVVSSDGGLTWPVSTKTTIFSVQANWPGMVALNSTTFLVMADHDGAKSQKVTLT